MVILQRFFISLVLLLSASVTAHAADVSVVPENGDATITVTGLSNPYSSTIVVNELESQWGPEVDWCGTAIFSDSDYETTIGAISAINGDCQVSPGKWYKVIVQSIESYTHVQINDDELSTYGFVRSEGDLYGGTLITNLFGSMTLQSSSVVAETCVAKIVSFPFTTQQEAMVDGEIVDGVCRVTVYFETLDGIDSDQLAINLQTKWGQEPFQWFFKAIVEN